MSLCQRQWETTKTAGSVCGAAIARFSAALYFSVLLITPHSCICEFLEDR